MLIFVVWVFGVMDMLLIKMGKIVRRVSVGGRIGV